MLLKMKRCYENNELEQVEFAKDLEEMTGVNIMDGRNIKHSISCHHTAEMRRAETKKIVSRSIEEYIKNGGPIHIVPEVIIPPNKLREIESRYISCRPIPQKKDLVEFDPSSDDDEE